MNPTQSDHDLLLVLHTEMQGMRKDIQDVKDSLKDNFGDHEARLRVLEESRSVGIGEVRSWASAGAIASFAASLLFEWIMNKR